MEAWSAVVLILNLMTLCGVVGLYYRLRAVERETAVRRVIRSLDEVPPELMSKGARDYIADTIERARGPVRADSVVALAVEYGVTYSQAIRARNLAEGLDEEALPDRSDPGPHVDPEAGTEG